MTTTTQSSPPLWPDVWSGDLVFAPSGMDGPTSWADGLDARTLPDRLGIEFDPPTSLRLVLHVVAGGSAVGLVPPTGNSAGQRTLRLGCDRVQVDLPLDGSGGAVAVTLVYAAPNLVRGSVRVTAGAAPSRPAMLLLELTAEAAARVDAEGLATPRLAARLSCDPAPSVAVVAPDQVSDAVARAAETGADPRSSAAGLPDRYQGPATRRSGLWCLPLAAGEEGPAQAQFALALSPADQPVAAQVLPAAELARLSALPVLPPAAGPWARARAKAVAVLRGSVFAPEGGLPRRWAVSQRLHQRNFNLFHAPFMALGALAFDAELALDIVRSALAQQQPNGQMPEQAWPDGRSSVMPAPLLCWAVWRTYQATGQRELLTETVDRLRDYVKHPLGSRMLEGLGYARSRGAKFLTWGRGEGASMDNSPRFDINEPFAAVDLTAYCVSEIHLLAQIIETLTPGHREAVHLGWLAEELAREVQEYLWDDERGGFVDRYPDGDAVDACTIAGLTPLFAGVATPAQARTMVERQLLNPDVFWTAFPVASLSRADPRHDQNQWPGGTWPALNVLLCEGLRRYGFHDAAAELRERTLSTLSEWYERTGTFWEFYDSSGVRAPAELPRGRRRGALPDHAWTAAAFLRLLHEPDAS